MKNKAFAVIVCLVLVVAMAIPGTLATSTDTDSSQTNTTAEVPATPETPAETPAPNEQPTEGTPEQPEQPAEETPVPSETPKECTCGAAEGESHKEGCPLYTAPAESEKPADSTHIDGCSDDCTDESCQCVCHLFNKIMACKTLDEIWAIFEEATDEAIAALTDEQNAQIDAKIAALEPAPAPAIVVEQSNDETVPSEIVYPTVNYTYVAPFGEPVTGGHR